MPKTDLQLSLHFMSRRIEPIAQTLFAAVRIDAPKLPTERQPLDLIACVDVSGSMAGSKIERMRRSLEKLVEQLSAGDRLGIVAFESQVHTLLVPTPMTPEGKEVARQRISHLQPLGTTAMSAGLRASLELLAKNPRSEAFRRVLLFTDGHANVGLGAGDLAGFTALLQEAGEGSSASFFGYGEDHDGPFLSELADLAGGNYHQAVDADAILDTFGRELGGLLSVVATDLEVRVRPHDGVGEAKFLNDFRVVGEGGVRALHLPEVYAEERRWILFELPFGKPASPLPSERQVAEVEVVWRIPAGSREQLSLEAAVELVDAGLADEPDLQVKEQLVLLQAARAQKLAAELAEQGKFESASQLIEAAAGQARALGTELGLNVSRILEDTVPHFADRHLYYANRSSLASLRRGMARSRASGAPTDALFETIEQADMREVFRGVVLQRKEPEEGET